MEIILVAAVSDNSAIGKKNGLLWHMPADLAFFEQTIKGTTLLTGRTSYESAQGGDIFQGKQPAIIITRQEGYQAEHAEVVPSIEAAFQLAQKEHVDRLCILGGASIYKQTIDRADKLIITEIHGTFEEADAFFPAIAPTKWKEISRENHTKDKENPYDYSFVVYVPA